LFTFTGQARVAGEEWLVRRAGAYLPRAYEEVVERCNATVITDKTAVHVRALRTFTDQMGVRRKTGEE
jgi:major vault protein